MLYGARVSLRRLDHEGRQLLTYFLLLMVGIVAWNLVFFRTLHVPPPWATTPAGVTIRLLLVLAGGGLAALGCRRVSVEANFLMRPLQRRNVGEV